MKKKPIAITIIVIVVVFSAWFAFSRYLISKLNGDYGSNSNTQNSALATQPADIVVNSEATTTPQTSPSAQKISSPTMTIGSTVLKIELADTVDERTLGLSNRKSMPQDTGLLFVFEESGDWGFWMKDMNFPIDIIWLDENFKVVGLKENATPESYPQVFKSAKPAKYVLETNVGFAKLHNIKIGTQLESPR